MGLGKVYCGRKTTGTFRLSETCLMLRVRPPKGPDCSSTLAGDHDQTDAGLDVGVQVHSHVVFAYQANGAVGQTHFALGHFHAGGGQGVGDVGGADRAEQFAFIARGSGDGDFQFVQLGSASFGRSLLLGSQLFQLGATGFERSNVLGGCRGSLALSPRLPRLAIFSSRMSSI